MKNNHISDWYINGTADGEGTDLERFIIKKLALAGAQEPDPTNSDLLPQYYRWYVRKRSLMWRYLAWRGWMSEAPPRAIASEAELDELLGLGPAQPPQPDTFRRIKGPIWPGMAAFMDDEGHVLPVFCHAGDLFALWLRDPEWAEEVMRSIFKAGYQGVRTWTWLAGEYWERLQRTCGPRQWDRIPAFNEALWRHGLWWMVSMGDLTRQAPADEWPVYCEKLASQLGDGIASVDVGNEAWNGVPSLFKMDLDQAMAAMLGEKHVPVRSLTDSPEDDPRRWHTDAATVVDVHNYRQGRMHDKIRHIFSMVWEQDMPRPLGILSEPWGAPTTQQGGLVSVTDNPDQIDDEACALQAVQAATFGWWFVHMSSPGVSIRRRGEFEASPGFAIVPKVINALPSNIMTWRDRAHGGASQGADRVFVAGERHGDLRCDQASNGRDVAVVCYADEGALKLSRAERAVEGQWLDLRTGTYGDPVAYSVGQSLRVPLGRHGAMFVGHFV